MVSLFAVQELWVVLRWLQSRQFRLVDCWALVRVSSHWVHIIHCCRDIKAHFATVGPCCRIWNSSESCICCLAITWACKFIRKLSGHSLLVSNCGSDWSLRLTNKLGLCELISFAILRVLWSRNWSLLRLRWRCRMPRLSLRFVRSDSTITLTCLKFLLRLRFFHAFDTNPSQMHTFTLNFQFCGTTHAVATHVTIAPDFFGHGVLRYVVCIVSLASWHFILWQSTVAIAFWCNFKWGWVDLFHNFLFLSCWFNFLSWSSALLCCWCWSDWLKGFTECKVYLPDNWLIPWIINFELLWQGQQHWRRSRWLWSLRLWLDSDVLHIVLFFRGFSCSSPTTITFSFHVVIVACFASSCILWKPRQRRSNPRSTSITLARSPNLHSQTIENN